jgi:ABC-type bacteriocin/lantibiotic exporter with double-glycine peptidase domain
MIHKQKPFRVQETLNRGPFPLLITCNEDHFLITTIQGNHYAKTFDPSAAFLIAAAPDLLDALGWSLSYIKVRLASEPDPDHQAAFDAAFATLRKAKGEA